MPYNFIQLNSSAKLYFGEVLSDGLTMAKSLFKSIDLDQGSFFTFLPFFKDPKSISNFNFGGVESSNKARQYMIQFLFELRKKYQNNLIVFENRYALPNDPVLANCHSQILFFGCEVYHVADNETSDELLLTTLIESATSIKTSFVVFGNTKSVFWHFSPKNTSDWVTDLVPHCISIIVTAFDGEGFIIWLKNEAVKNLREPE